MATQAIDRQKCKHALKVVARKAPRLVNRSNKRTLKQLVRVSELSNPRFLVWSHYS